MKILLCYIWHSCISTVAQIHLHHDKNNDYIPCREDATSWVIHAAQVQNNTLPYTTTPVATDTPKLHVGRPSSLSFPVRIANVLYNAPYTVSTVLVHVEQARTKPENSSTLVLGHLRGRGQK